MSYGRTRPDAQTHPTVSVRSQVRDFLHGAGVGRGWTAPEIREALGWGSSADGPIRTALLSLLSTGDVERTQQDFGYRPGVWLWWSHLPMGPANGTPS
jgi:hypothetical protein